MVWGCGRRIAPRRRALLEHDLGHLVDSHPDLRDRARFTLPYITHVHRARRAR
ncbi:MULTISPECIES: hypothetical protein [unclassified Streptomyces]|uniref:hypothetical protein n=1 Tax=unclassified Streptomyces TaxID=2593676 RepID=UPI0037FF7335